jgi:pyrroloquinoline quinone biosynthesis protein B
MRVRILGSAAGGGFPQWNCNCRRCKAARENRACPRTQSSVAVRGGESPWVLINASPDLRQQLAELPVDRTRSVRETPFGAVLLTDAEIDHTAGLLLLRESSAPIRVYSTEAVRAALAEQYPVLRMLEHYCGVDWRPLEPGAITRLEGSSLEVEAFPTGGDPPRYMGEGEGPSSIGLRIRDRDGGVVCYAPAVEALDGPVLAGFRGSDCVLVDGTFWCDDELPSLGLGARNGRAMGHAPLSGPEGTLAALAALGPRTVLVHVNNTNPILLEDSEERATVEASGVEVSYDGMEIDV